MQIGWIKKLTDISHLEIVYKAFFNSFSFSTPDNPKLSENNNCDITGNTIWFWQTHNVSLKGLVPSFDFEQDKVTLINPKSGEEVGMYIRVVRKMSGAWGPASIRGIRIYGGMYRQMV